MKALLFLVLALLSAPLRAEEAAPVPDARLTALETRLTDAQRRRDAGQLPPPQYAAFVTPFRAELSAAGREVPQSPVNVALVSRLYARLGDGTQSLSSLDAALQQSPGDPTLLRAKGLALYESGDRAGAASLARELYAASGNSDRAAYALIMLSEGRAPNSVRLPGQLQPERSAVGADGAWGEDSRPAVLAMRAVRSDLLPPAPVGDAPLTADATTTDIARVAFTTAATAAGGLLLFMGLGGSELEERFPGIRMKLGIGAAVAGAFAITVESAPAMLTLFTNPSTVEQESRAIDKVAPEIPAATGESQAILARSGPAVQNVTQQAVGEVQAVSPHLERIRSLLYPGGRLVGDGNASRIRRLPGQWRMRRRSSVA